jgi:hypothetical protein
MNLFSYFSSKNYNDFIQINQFYIYKQLLDKKQTESLLKKYDNLDLFTYSQLELYADHRKDKIIQTIRNDLKLDMNSDYDFYVKNSKGNVSEKNKLNLSDNVFSRVDYSDKPSLVILKPKIKKIKNFTNLNQLIDKSPNIGLYVHTVNKMIIVIGYDNLLMDDLYNLEKDYIFPILFYGIISNVDRIKEPIPFQGSFVNLTVVRNDVSGRNILYPILGYFSNNNVLISDRDSMSDQAQGVWNHFYFKKEIFDIIDPIDDVYKPITLNRSEDDGRLFTDDKAINKNSEYNINSIKQLSDEKQLKLLREIRKEDPYNWAYKLKSEYITLSSQIVDELEKRHERFLKEKDDPFGFQNKLIKLSKKLFDKRY